MKKIATMTTACMLATLTPAAAQDAAICSAFLDDAREFGRQTGGMSYQTEFGRVHSMRSDVDCSSKRVTRSMRVDGHLHFFTKFIWATRRTMLAHACMDKGKEFTALGWQLVLEVTDEYGVQHREDVRCRP